MQTNDRPLTDLMKAIAEGKAQLPDFQRGWVWDDNRIKAPDSQCHSQLSRRSCHVSVLWKRKYPL